VQEVERWPISEEYVRIRQAVMEIEEGRNLVHWVQRRSRPQNADEMALGLASAVITSGFGYTPGMAVLDRVTLALREGKALYPEVFAHKLKARTIEQIWHDREQLFSKMLKVNSVEQALTWCESIPYVGGPAVRYQVARDLALADVAKPDRHLLRMAEKCGESVQELCKRVAARSGDSIGTVDMVLWYAAHAGIIKCDGSSSPSTATLCVDASLRRLRRALGLKDGQS
jgi:hypothetical protein